jgi:ATP-dependent protease ClpP protease subunit
MWWIKQTVMALLLSITVSWPAMAHDGEEGAEDDNDYEVVCLLATFEGPVAVENILYTIGEIKDCLDQNVPTTLTIMSFGGDPTLATAFYDMVAQHPHRQQLTTVVTGVVGPSALPLFLAADKRLITPKALLMSVKLDIRLWYAGHEELKTAAEALARQLALIISERTNITASVADKLLTDSIVLSAPEAVEMGLATAVLP